MPIETGQRAPARKRFPWPLWFVLGTLVLLTTALGVGLFTTVAVPVGTYTVMWGRFETTPESEIPSGFSYYTHHYTNVRWWRLRPGPRSRLVYSFLLLGKHRS